MKIKKLPVRILVASLMIAVLVPDALIAQVDGSSQGEQELRQQVIELQSQLKRIQARLDETESAKTSPTTTQTPAPSSAQEDTTQVGQPPLRGPTSPHVGEATATYDTFAGDSACRPSV